ncbi:MAG TPA: rhomboid family intramembrane serine protease [Bacillota bacterium]|jgi:membrane associated rhomboid family serine protease|nr:rhomboid family intramembrane serine protease [Bacillota bacterium]HPT33440.1 rhomboid family intramembrane serine protease [Bacillota bacterium]
MKWLNKLERRYGRYAVKNLMLYIIGLNALIFVWVQIDPAAYHLLVLHPSLVLRGELWRLVTFIFIPPTFSPLWLIFTLYFYYLVGSGLEQAWGSFKFNVYYLVGMIATILAAFITGHGATGVYLNLSLFFAFATLYPDFQVLLFFILPVKVKYLAWLNAAFLGYTLLFSPWPLKVAALASVLNYFIFFGEDIFRQVKLKNQVWRNRRRFFAEVNKARRNRK